MHLNFKGNTQKANVLRNLPNTPRAPEGPCSIRAAKGTFRKSRLIEHDYAGFRGLSMFSFSFLLLLQTHGWLPRRSASVCVACLVAMAARRGRASVGLPRPIPCRIGDLKAAFAQSCNLLCFCSNISSGCGSVSLGLCAKLQFQGPRS